MTDPYQTGNAIMNDVLATAPSGEPLPEECRGSWYCPCATERHETLVRTLSESFGVDTVYDLGAGDLRLSVALSDDYEVIAYELNEDLVNVALQHHDWPDVEVRQTDYYADWDRIKNDRAVFVAIGRTNRLPSKPPGGPGIQGHEDLLVTQP